ncbi:MAG TPA: 1-acyl-sn-glycerol-3-phosphate acyltransferase [Thermoanaerobaculia bacterium]|nr:1-acyl-sn-glycerol-3-phosphate acyltransferase [Thermoanaerobaculia bacterium]
MTSWALAVGVAAVALVLALLLAPRSARRLIREKKLRIERFKLKRKHEEIAAAVFASARVRSAIVAWSAERGVAESEGERKAREYFREIVPKFNLLAYYRFGAPIARLFLNTLYRVVVNRGPMRRFSEGEGKRAVVVFAINHRSNTDYLLVAHMLFKFISLSYAVGEWARVWPLNHLFKWFGAYFIRRRFREALYHAVLSEFVATITRRGVTQGIFIEGGLSRDGAWQKPKLGMLDYIVGSKRDRSFTEPLYIIPTAINYDRVLEDRVLTHEMVEPGERSGRWEQARTTAVFFLKNTLRILTGRLRRYGYAIVTFGEPVSVDEFVLRHPEVLSEDFEEKKPALRELARTIIERTSDALPVTPVTLVARIFRDRRSAALSEAEILREIDRLRAAEQGRPWLIREHASADVWRAAKRVLRLRRLIEVSPGGWRWSPQEPLLLDYYANALVPYEEVERRGWAGRVGSLESGVGSLLPPEVSSG